MSLQIQVKRGLASGIPTLADGEPGWTTDTHVLYVGQGGVNYQVGGTAVDDQGGILASRVYQDRRPSPVAALSGASPGQYGDSTHVAQVTIDVFGRVTGASSVAITAGTPEDANSVLASQAFAPRSRMIQDGQLPPTNVPPGRYGGSAGKTVTFVVDQYGRLTDAGQALIGISATQIGSGQVAVAMGGTGIDASSAANGTVLIGNGSGFTLANLTAGTGVSITNGGGSISIAATNSGTVTSVGTGTSLSGGPITGSGTINVVVEDQNLVLARQVFGR